MCIIFILLPLESSTKGSGERAFSNMKGGGELGDHLPLSYTHALTQIFQNALCVVL